MSIVFYGKYVVWHTDYSQEDELIVVVDVDHIQFLVVLQEFGHAVSVCVHSCSFSDASDEVVDGHVFSRTLSRPDLAHLLNKFCCLVLFLLIAPFFAAASVTAGKGA